MLDDLHEHRGVEAGEAVVAIRQRSLQQPQALALALVHPLQAEAPCGDLQGPGRHVHADDLGEGMVLDQFAQEAALTTAEVQHALRAAGPQGRHDRPDPLVVEADPLLDGGLLGIAVGLDGIGIRRPPRRRADEGPRA